MLADKSRAVVGSINLTATSFDDRRELAIRVTNRDVVDRLVRVAHGGWRDSHALDLSDRAMLSDLQQHPNNGGLAKIASPTDQAD